MTTVKELFLNRLERIQRKLEFVDWADYPLFATKQGIGRSALLACILGLTWGLHFAPWLYCSLHLLSGGEQQQDETTTYWLFSRDRIQMIWQWCSYAMALSTFHLLEFFTTAIYNPTVTNADSFLINHSTAYTAAALASWTEFTLRFLFCPHFNSAWLSVFCLVFFVLPSQTLRSAAMATAGESFNHIIQTSRKQNHVLVTRGVYRYLRHPSYVGFYYWSVGTQVVLGNVLHATAFAVVSWQFFNRRIPYEEESLCRLFPDEYPAYVARSYTGIPFLKTQVRLKDE